MSKKMLIQRHEEDLPNGKPAYLIGNTHDDTSFKVPDPFDLSKPQDHPKYGKVWFRFEGGSFIWLAYGSKKKFAKQTESGFYDYLLYDGGHDLVEVKSKKKKKEVDNA